MRSDCPVSFALDNIGDKWTFLIIRDLVEGKRFYKDFMGSKEGIATNILSDRLKKLEANGLIRSQVYEKLKTQKEYFLTEKGKDLIPILVEFMLWSAKHQTGLAIPEGFVEGATKNRDLVVQRIYSGLN